MVSRDNNEFEKLDNWERGLRSLAMSARADEDLGGGAPTRSAFTR